MRKFFLLILLCALGSGPMFAMLRGVQSGSQIVIRDASGRVVSTAQADGVNAAASMAPAAGSVSFQGQAGVSASGPGIPDPGLPWHRLKPVPTRVARTGAGMSVPGFGVIYHIAIRDAAGKLVHAEDLHNLTTTAGANRLLGLFEGGVLVTSENDSNTPSSGSTYSFTSLSPMIMPGTDAIAVASIGTCADQGNGTCTGAGFASTGTLSSINYNSGAVTLQFSSSLGAAHATTSSYKQAENGATCTAANIAATGNGCWFIGIYKGSSAPSLVIADTMASHSFTEVTLGTDVTQTARPAWIGTGTPSSGSDSNSGSVVTYNSGASSNYTLQGIFLVDNSGSSSTTAGTLDGEVNLTTAQPIGGSYTIQITATLSVTAG